MEGRQKTCSIVDDVVGRCFDEKESRVFGKGNAKKHVNPDVASDVAAVCRKIIFDEEIRSSDHQSDYRRKEIVAKENFRRY
jgi:hypothetical protein